MSDLTRRSFISTGTAAAVGSALPSGNRQTQTNFSRPIIGYWTREIAERLHWKDAKTAVLTQTEHDHEGPVFKFPVRPLNARESAICHITFDACYRRGKENHRPATRIVVRVKPANGLPDDEGNLVLEEEQYRGCYLGPRSSPVYLTKSTWTHRNNCICGDCAGGRDDGRDFSAPYEP